MKNKNVKRIAMALTVLMIVGSAAGCGAKNDTAAETTSKTETTTEKLDESATQDLYTGIDDVETEQKAPAAGKDDTVKKSDGSDVTTETQAPASTTEINGTVVDSNKNEVQPETTAKPTPAPSTNNSGGSDNSDSNSNAGISGDNASGESSAESSTPAHVHSFATPIYRDEPVYGTERVQVGTRTVVDSAAWDEEVLVFSGARCIQCGYTTSDRNAMDYHMLDNGHSCTTHDEYETVHHAAATHEESVYEDRQVQTGTTQVVAGYKCSCGATQ